MNEGFQPMKKLEEEGFTPATEGAGGLVHISDPAGNVVSAETLEKARAKLRAQNLEGQQDRAA